MPWINAAHKNGVAILGTIIVYDGSFLSSILCSETYMRRIVDALVGVTKRCQFDGWFFNVQSPVHREEVPRLEMLLRTLTHRIHEDIPGGKVFWYNSLTSDGSLKFQSELNEENIMYFNVCDGIFINTAWNLENLERTQGILCGNERAMAKVFIGIDVFGRGQEAGFNTVNVSSIELLYSNSISCVLFTFLSLK